MAPSSRRDFLTSSGTAVFAPAARPGRYRMALVGTGSRGCTMWGRSLLSAYREKVELVGLCDTNGKRAEAARGYIGTSAPAYVDFDRMIAETRPNLVVVTTPDATHWRYILRAMELGCEVITEKAIATDEQKCQALLDGCRRMGGKLTVAFNARHIAGAKKMKQLLMEKAVGDVVSVVYQEYLDTSHGASYFRRWHRLKQMNGTLLVTKSCHHFDQVNWWLDARPVEVRASGSLRVYGRNNSFRSSHCRVCPYQKQCPFYWNIATDEFSMRMFAACESEDGYFRDGCVWREDADIYDNSSVMVRYENGVNLTYVADAYLPYEGQAITVNGTRGRIDWMAYGGGGFRDQEFRLTRTFRKSELIPLTGDNGGGHGGADDLIKRLIFDGEPAGDPLRLRAGLEEGILSALVGIAGYRSIERGGEAVLLSSLVKL
ncbi:MAG: Gfo/Idh/MocA family oxidoreductase [Bryobacterales bacterium]|nr:Gfo/Idh/MocA family oxidoreductase [Bryobacterales bacterium]